MVPGWGKQESIQSFWSKLTMLRSKAGGELNSPAFFGALVDSRLLEVRALGGNVSLVS
jgi:hypothetical protein